MGLDHSVRKTDTLCGCRDPPLREQALPTLINTDLPAANVADSFLPSIVIVHFTATPP